MICYLSERVSETPGAVRGAETNVLLETWF